MDGNEIPVTEVLISDIEEIRDVLGACLTYFTAQDVIKAQTQFRQMRQSPITSELERVKARVDGLMGDYLLFRYQAEKGESEEEPKEEELPDNPLGSPKFSSRAKEHARAE